jgi:Phage integrase, N-terminal SAM-like domain
MITLLRKRMHHDLQLAGLAVGTQKVYLGAVQQLAAHYHRAPDQLTEEQVRDYLLLQQRLFEGRARKSF